MSLLLISDVSMFGAGTAAFAAGTSISVSRWLFNYPVIMKPTILSLVRSRSQTQTQTMAVATELSNMLIILTNSAILDLTEMMYT